MIFAIARCIYNLLLILAFPLILLQLVWRGIKTASYRKRWLERLGIFSAPEKTGGIWIHTVSVGEFMAALPMIQQLLQRYSHELITVTTTTPTGSARVLATLGTSVLHVYLPYDYPFGINNFLRLVRPSLGIILETELWPNLLHACKVNKIPVLLVNGCVSPRSFRGYKLIHWIVREMLLKFTYVMAKSAVDGERFLQLGLPADKLSIPGNIKYDMPVQTSHIALGQELRQSWGHRLVIVAASTHAGEEQQILDALKIVQPQIPEVLLVLVPRHPERFTAVAELIQSYGFTMVRRSLGETCSATTAIFLGDTMGELGIFYQAADIAFIGGSLVPIGGHNALEAAAAGLPVISGRYMYKCQEVSEAMLAANAMVMVNNAQELATVLLNWLRSATVRKQIGTNAKNFVVNNQGAINKILTVIDRFMAQE